ncbi:MAG: amidohydrolase family protein [Deltaproteobacteria bacterium]|nr:amidohydrolase family protein [Deltaproteobacteria bacterium]
MSLLSRILNRVTPRSSAAAPAPWPQAPQSIRVSGGDGGALTIRAGWLIDGRGGPVRRNVRIVAKDGGIVGLWDASAEPEGFAAEVLPDYSGCTVIPGLVDSHVHLTLSGSADEEFRKRLRAASYESIRRVIGDHLQDHLNHGVVAVRDGGGTRGYALRCARGYSGPVRVCAAGRAWHREGRYGRLIGRPPGKGLGLAEAIRQDDEPVDHLKIVNSGLNSLTEYGKQSAPQFDLRQMSAAVKAAAERGLSIMVHANGAEPVRIAVAAVCRSIEHGFFMGKDNLARMADQGVTWVPTVVTMSAYARIFEQTGRNPDVALRTLDHQLEQLAIARLRGVRLALGTDSGSPGVDHGAAVIEEMKHLMQAGYSLPEAIHCATLNGARLIGGEFGLIEPGRPATFVIVEGGPSTLPEGLRKIRAVFICGIKQFEAG